MVGIREFVPSDVSNTIRNLFFGQVTKVHANRNGRSGMRTLTVSDIKAGLDVPLGVSATTTCAWTFGDKSCCKDISSLASLRQITIGAQNAVTLSGSAPGREDYFHRGYLEFDGCRIMVRSANYLSLTLVRTPPPEWQGMIVRCMPGCDKSSTCCDEKWNNINRFGGFGFHMPAYHPNMETS
jgi:hypothetical protein